MSYENKRIRELIEEKGLTIMEVASRAGIAAPTLSRLIKENPKGSPTVAMLERIAIAIDVDIRELFEVPCNDLYGLVQHKGRTYKIDSLESLKRLILKIESDKLEVV